VGSPRRGKGSPLGKGFKDYEEEVRARSLGEKEKVEPRTVKHSRTLLIKRASVRRHIKHSTIEEWPNPRRKKE